MSRDVRGQCPSASMASYRRRVLRRGVRHGGGNEAMSARVIVQNQQQ